MEDFTAGCRKTTFISGDAKVPTRCRASSQLTIAGQTASAERSAGVFYCPDEVHVLHFAIAILMSTSVDIL